MSLRRLIAVPVSVALLGGLGLLAGCGSDDDDDGADAAGGGEPTAAVDTSALLSCLRDAGLDAEPNDALPFGVSDPVAGIEVAAPAVDLWVFADAATAEADRVAITLSDTDTPRSQLVGTTVVSFDEVPDEGDPGVASVRDCVGA